MYVIIITIIKSILLLINFNENNQKNYTHIIHIIFKNNFKLIKIEIKIENI